MAENFDLIFGQNASQQYAWSDNDYQNGWETVGSIPPTAAQFDALQRRADTKAQELNNNLAPLVAQNTANNRQPLTAYELKDIRYNSGLPVGWYLECTTAGTTDSAEITLPSPLVENATVTDGTVVWTIREVASTADIPAPVDISGKANVSLDNLSAAGINVIKQNSGGISAQSLAQSGYVKFSNGLIVQWGYVVSSAVLTTVTFPIAFTSAVYVVNVGQQTKVTDNADFFSFGARNITKTTFTIKKREDSNGCWIAIGR